MSDIRALLDEAAARPAAHPDPVRAVHGRVRQRAHRHRAAVAAGASAAVATAAAGTAVLDGRRRDRALPPAASGSASATSPPATRYSAFWRVGGAGGVVAVDDTIERVSDLVADHRDVFVALRARAVDSGNTYTFVLSGDADQAAWEDDMARAAGDRPWDVTRCEHTAAYLDRAATEVLSAEWPSGATVARGELVGWSVSYVFPCTVRVRLSTPYVTPQDTAYARDRWLGAVVPVGTLEGDQ